MRKRWQWQWGEKEALAGLAIWVFVWMVVFSVVGEATHSDDHLSLPAVLVLCVWVGPIIVPGILWCVWVGVRNVARCPPMRRVVEPVRDDLRDSVRRGK